MAYRFVILAAVLLLNGFFATAEVALVSVRKSRLRTLADEGQVGAQAALNLAGESIAAAFHDAGRGHAGESGPRVGR